MKPSHQLLAAWSRRWHLAFILLAPACLAILLWPASQLAGDSVPARARPTKTRATGPTADEAASYDRRPAVQVPAASVSGFATGLKVAVTPAGNDVSPTRQIVLRFDRPMVPVGHMERRGDELPVAIEPNVACGWRWSNPQTLTCQLEKGEGLVPATRYRVVVRSGLVARDRPSLVARDGTTLAMEHHHEFLTWRPGLTRTYFHAWRAPGRPELSVYTNQPVSLDSLRHHLYFATGDRRRYALDVQAPARPHAKDQVFVVRPNQDLPANTALSLEVEPGLVSLDGAEKSVVARTLLELFTFPEPRFLGLRCTDDGGDEARIDVGATLDPGPARDLETPPEIACDPEEPVYLLFASPVTPNVLRDHLVVEPDLARGRPDRDPWQEVHGYSRLSQPRHTGGEVYEVPLPGPLEAESRYRLTAPGASVRDEFGRPLSADLDLEFETGGG